MCNGVERAIQFLAAPFLGNISDCLGRQPVMLLSLLLHVLALVVVIIKPVRLFGGAVVVVGRLGGLVGG
jgi:hypothetical protein